MLVVDRLPYMEELKPVLVVDDDEINLVVATEELELQGYSYETASHGEEACGMVKDREYRLIFMDCQMPVMDGFAATREIRAWEKKHHRRVPIVALTGHADDREQKKADAAGMDDFLSKPLNSKDLRRVMSQFPGGRSAIQWPPPPPDLAPGVRRSRRLMQLFLEHVPEQLQTLREAWLLANANEVRNQAHKLKGTCLAIAAPPMAEVAERLRALADTGDLTDANPLVLEIEKRFEAVENLIHWEMKSTRV